MIVTRTPFRVTLGGGGTDLPSFYEKHGGFVFAMGIDKYMYVVTNPPVLDRKIRVRYSRTEIVDHVGELRHELAREALRLHGIEDRMEIDSIADLPAGAGLGSSSAYLVGLLLALRSYRRDFVSLEQLAEEACHIELDVLGKRIGKQDQYMAAFGGLTTLEIDRRGEVRAVQVNLRESAAQTFVAHTHIYYTGLLRNAPEILADQDQAMRKATLQSDAVERSLNGIKELGHRICDAICDERFDDWGLMLHEHWEHKKRLSPRITVSWVDQVYQEVRERFDVLGGKIIGAGGGGFLMLFCPDSSRRLEDFMQSRGMPRLYYNIEREGSKVVANLASTQVMTIHPSAAQGSRLAAGGG